MRAFLALLIVSASVAGLCNKEQTETYLTAGTNYTPEVREIDYVLVLDRSGSMNGVKLDKVKDAAKSLVDLMPQTDRAALISFNYQASVDQSLTKNRTALYNSIDSLQAGFGTKYIPPLLYAQKEFLDSNKTKALIFLSDGKDDVAEQDEDILQITRSLASQGVCIVTISYALGGEESALLQKLSDAGKAAGCGRQFVASEKGEELREVFEQIHKEISSIELLNVKSAVSGSGYSTIVTSKLNDRRVPGQKDDACADSPNILLTVYKDKHLIGTYSGGASQLDLPAGNYNYRMSALLDCNGECAYSGYDEGNFTMGGVCTPSYEQLATYVTGETQNVLITATGFVPRTISGRQGTLVVWKNQDIEPRHLLSESFDVTINPGETFTYIIENLGTLIYQDPDKHVSGSVTPIYGTGNDILVIVDESGSMKGEGIKEAKEATTKFYNLLSPVDRGALITFSQSATVLQDFTSDKEILEYAASKLSAEAATNYLPALALAKTMHRKQPGVVVFMSDGLPTDPEFRARGANDIVKATKALRQDGWCIMTIAFSSEGLAASNVLTQMAGQDECTAFLYASNGKLAEVFGTIYQLAKSQSDISFNSFNVPQISFSNKIKISAQLITKTGKLIPGGLAPACAPPASVIATSSKGPVTLTNNGDLYEGTLTVGSGVQRIRIIGTVSASDRSEQVFAASAAATVLVVPFWFIILVLVTVGSVIYLLWRPKS